MLISCSDNSTSHDYIEKKKYDIENAVDGKYTVIYTQTSAIPDDLLNIEIKKDDDVIFKFGTDAKGQYKLPEKVAYLFNYDGGDVYYVQNHTGLLMNGTEYDPLCFVVCDGENVPDFMDNDNSICINNIDNSFTGNPESWSKKFESASEFLRENITEQEITDIFDKCGYDDKYILEVYNYEVPDGRD